MTREEALQILDTIPTIGEQVDALEMAIKALEQEPCKDAISRHDAIHLADELKYDLPDDERISDIAMAHNEAFLEYQTKLSLLPSVTPQQRMGRWIRASANRCDGKRECTECGGWWIYGGHLPDYCPSCGAKMEDGG